MPARGDLALLPVLQELLRTRSTTLAARRLGCTQSSASHALARLRIRFGDPLLVRVGRSLRPTRFAEELAPSLDAVLGAADGLFVGGRAFAPALLDRTFTFGGTDFSELLIVPALARRLAVEAPAVDLVCTSAGAEVERQLQDRQLDLAFGTMFRERGGLIVKRVATDDLVLLVRRGHPLVARTTLDRYLAADHVLVAPRGTAGGVVDTALAALGATRRVAVRVGNFQTAAALVADSELVTAMPRACARVMVERLPLVAKELPLAVPAFSFGLAWSEQNARDPAHRWLRAIVERIAAAVFAPGVRGGARSGRRE